MASSFYKDINSKAIEVTGSLLRTELKSDALKAFSGAFIRLILCHVCGVDIIHGITAVSVIDGVS